jgi:hypothetical protein
MRLIHFNDAPVKLDTLIARGQNEHGDFKPRGLWVSDESCDSWGWREWCIAEDFNLGMLTHVHEVTLSNTAEILFLRSPEEIKAFGHEYRMTHGPLANINTRGVLQLLDWVRVIQKWHGIIITPYQWSCRLDFDCGWYYGWDCASGCLWEPSAIGSIILREVVEPPTPATYEDER